MSTRDLASVVDKNDVPAAIKDSEYLETIYIAVPKYAVRVKLIL